MRILEVHYKILMEESPKDIPVSVALDRRSIFVPINSESDYIQAKKHNCQFYAVRVTDDLMRVGILVPKASIFDHAYTK